MTPFSLAKQLKHITPSGMQPSATIGSHLCERLLAEGNDIICIDNYFTGHKSNIRHLLSHPNFEIIRHDIVYPCMAEIEEIYGDPLIHPQREDYWGHVNPLGIRSCYDEGKRCAESLFMSYYREHGIPVKIIRIFNTYGSGADLMDQRVVMKMIVAALQNRDIPINGSGEQLRTFCWVEDVVDGLVRLMEAPPAETTRTANFGSSHEVTIRSLAEKIIALTGSSSHIVHAEARIDDIRRRTPDISATRRELDWAPRTPLIEGLRRTISYVEKELAEKNYAGISWVEIN